MVSPRRFIALVFIVLAAFLSVGVVHGLWTERWASIGPSHDELAAEIEKVPLRLGSWEGKTEEISSHPLMAGATNYALRRYVNHADGTVAKVMLTRGRPGPMVIRHLPTECYVSNGYELVDGPKQFLSENPGKAADEFWVATFKKTTDVAPWIVRVYWSWTGDGRWRTPDRPRMTFASHHMLYKLYVVRPLPNENDEAESSPVHAFIKDLTGAMRESFFTGVPQ
jgi:hypothetical protein